MKKLLTLMLVICTSILLTACTEQQIKDTATRNQNSQTVASTKNSSPPPSSPQKSAIMGWKNFSTKHLTLAGKYPENFYFEDKGNPVRISSASNLLCTYADQCSGDGLEIQISMSPRIGGLDYLEKTKYPNIEKVKDPRKGKPENFYSGYNYQEYAYASKNEYRSYLIEIIEKNFQGNSAAIIDEILSSLHEE